MRARVTSLGDARAALAGGATLLVGEAGFAGIGWWREVLNILESEHPGVDAVLDCGPAPGLALAALRAGIRRVAVRAEPDVLAKLQAIAKVLGATVEAAPVEPLTS